MMTDGKMNKIILLKDKYLDVLVLILIGISVLIFCSPFLSEPYSRTVSSDLNVEIANAYFARSSILKHWQFPLRCPFYAGGYPLLAYPHDMSCSPLFLIILFFGELLGMKIIMVLLYMVCAFGMFYLTRKIMNFNLVASLVATLSLTFCSFLPAQLESGNFTKMFYYFVPLLIAFIIKSKEKKVFIVYAAFILSLILGQACASSGAIILFIFIFTGVYFAGRKREVLMMLRHTLLVVMLSVLLCALEIIPMVELFIKSKPNIYYENAQVHCFTFSSFLKSILFRYSENITSTYVGYGTLFFALLFFVFNFKESKKFLLLCLFLVLIMLGKNSPVNLTFFLSFVPRYNHTIRVDIYFAFFIAFLLCLAAGYAIKNIRFSSRHKTWTILAILMLVINTWDLFLNNTAFHKLVFYKNIKAPKIINTDFAQSLIIDGGSELDGFLQYELMKSNIGSSDWHTHNDLPDYTTPKYFIEGQFSQQFVFNHINIDEKTFFDSLNFNSNIARNSEIYNFLDWEFSLNPEYKGELYFLNEIDLNKASYDKFTPNKIVINAFVSKPDLLIINQNYDKYWKVDGGTLLSHKGLLAVQVDKPGRYKFTLTYVPMSFIIGLIISILATSACLWIIFQNHLIRVYKRTEVISI